MADLGGWFFFDRLTLFEESVAVPLGLIFLGGDDGGVLNKADFWVYGPVVFFGWRRLLRGPFGVGGVGDGADMAIVRLDK